MVEKKRAVSCGQTFRAEEVRLLEYIFQLHAKGQPVPDTILRQSTYASINRKIIAMKVSISKKEG